MSTTFVVALILAVIVLSNLRFFLLIACAVILALIATGIAGVSEVVAGDQPDTTIIAPAPSGPEPDDGAQSSDNLPDAEPEPPR